ncbi:MAG TPA: hypothetical protein G4O13_00790 [Dehalococcoidia bacterium]|nr:hypothetical protein [Dehalococcoidia bacterium]
MSQELPKEAMEVTYTTAEEMPQEIKNLIYEQWLPHALRGLLEGVRELPREYRDKVLKKMSRGCGVLGTPVVGVTPGMGLEAYKLHACDLQPPLGPRDIEQFGDVIQVDYHHPLDKDGKPVCHCPFVILGLIEPFPELCQCAANLGAEYIEVATGKPCHKVEVMASPHTTGDPYIRYLVYLKPPVSSNTRDE